MQKYKQALIVLFLVFTAFSAMADVSNQITIITSPTTNIVSGNSSVPLLYDSVDVYNNTLIINSSVSNNAYGGLNYGSGLVNNNLVTVNSGGSVNGAVYGGFGSAGVTLNNVEIYGTVTGVVYGGSSSSNDAVTDNTVVIESNGKANNYIMGGYSTANGDVINNTVIIEINGTGGSNASQAVYGGYSNGSGNISDNTVIINGTVNSVVYGGFSNDSATKTGIVSGNSVEINGTANNVFGGTGYSTVTYNTITISGSATALVCAGYSVGTGDATYNTVIIESTGSGGTVYGGYTGAAAGGNVTDNKVAISGSATNVYGGYAIHSNNTGVVEKNSVVINENAIVNNVYGGRTNGSGAVTDNVVAIAGTANDVYGGVINNASSIATVSDNAVTISGKVNKDVYGGYTAGAGSVTGNNVKILNDGLAAEHISGGYIDNTSNTAAVSGNSIEISGTVNSMGGSGPYHISGGYTSGSGTVSSNGVTVTSTGIVGGGAANFNIYGGLADGGGDATNNFINIENGGKANDAIFGGVAHMAGNATGNNIIIESGGLVASSVYGGITNGTGNANDNIVDISGSATGIVYGGEARGTGNASDNSVTISGSADSLVFGGYTMYGEGIGNTVIITRTGMVSSNVYGVFINTQDTNTKEARNNTVIMNGTAADVFGVRTYNYGNVTDNWVEIGGTANNVYGGYIRDASSTGILYNNTVIISGTANNNVFGGYTYGSGTVTSNSVTISGTAHEDVSGGWTYGSGDAISNSVMITSVGKTDGDVLGGYSANGNATDNMVTIDGTANQDVFGGISVRGNVNSNSITIGGPVNGTVYGGWVFNSGTVNDNTVNIEKTSNLANASLFGRSNNINGGTGNTLNVNSFVGDVVEINNFDIYNITIGELDSSLTVINITGGTPADIENATINIYFAPEFANNVLASNHEIIVISSINLPLYGGNDPIVMVEQGSPFVTYGYIETHDTGQLLLTLTGLTVNPETAFVGEGFAAGLAFLGQAADVRSSIYFVPQAPRFIPFAKMVYGKQYISTGSSVNVKGFSAIAGLALNTNFDNGSQLVVGAFVEGGWGDYDSHNSFSTSATIKGSGDTEYYGGGVLARYALKTGLYSEGSFAAGKTETDFRTYDFTPGTRSKYDYSVPYYSAHLAVGKIFNMNDIFALDIYGKYLWTRQAGDNVTVDGYRFKFKAADSHRVRVGVKLQATGLPQLQPYVGAAYEYEFSGRIKGSLYGMNLDKPSLRGGTGIGELGLVWSPNDAQNLRVDLGVQGYVGKREGVSGGLTVTMSF